MIFTEYSLQPNAYPAGAYTSPDIYKCMCAGLVVVASLGTAPGLLKEEEEEERRKKKEDEQSGRAAILVCHSGTSGSFAKGIFRIRKTSRSILDI